MRDPFSRLLHSFQSTEDSLLHRVRENFLQLLTPARIFPSSANGAPIHLLTQENGLLTTGPRVLSFLTHAGLVAAILLVHLQSPPRRGPVNGSEAQPHGPLTFFQFPDSSRFGQPSVGKRGGGGEEEPAPPRRGLLAPGSSIPILPPRRTMPTDAELQVPETVFDPNASQFPAPVANLGLPWMHNDSDSPGPGKKHGYGTGREGGMGDDKGPGAGRGDAYNGPYANVVTRPACAYCPDPQYTDEAREAKLQGTVAVEVLVSAEGRPTQMRVARGIAMGLDERAVETIRGWKFLPARDASHRPVATWVTVEVNFRLI
jgi:periplasmic protein TonB